MKKNGFVDSMSSGPFMWLILSMGVLYLLGMYFQRRPLREGVKLFKKAKKAAKKASKAPANFFKGKTENCDKYKTAERNAESKRIDEERRRKTAERKLNDARKERSKAMDTTKREREESARLIKEAENKVKAERTRLLVEQRRTRNQEANFRERLARERKQRIAVEETLFETRDKIDAVRNKEIKRCKTEKDKIAERRRRQDELRLNRIEAKNAMTRKRLEDEKKERLRLDQLRRDRRGQLAEQRSNVLRTLQMNMATDAAVKREEAQMRQVNTSRRAIEEAGLQTGDAKYSSLPASIYGSGSGTPGSQVASGRRDGKPRGSSNRQRQYGIYQSNVFLKPGTDKDEPEGVVVDKIAKGGFLLPF